VLEAVRSSQSPVGVPVQQVALVRGFAEAHPDAVVELSMRRSLPRSLAALHRHEVDMALGNAANLDSPLAANLAAVPVTTTPLAALVSERGPLAAASAIGPDELRRHGLWWPVQASSAELSAFAVEYAQAIGAPLATGGVNMGIDVLLRRVTTDPATVTLVGLDWPIPSGSGVRVIPVRPVPHYPWYAVWRKTNAHPLVSALIRHLREAGHFPGPHHGCWLPARTRQHLQAPPLRSG
jgi:hypothetical protein